MGDGVKHVTYFTRYNYNGSLFFACPAYTELETIVMYWLGKMIGLSADFLHSDHLTMEGGMKHVTYFMRYLMVPFFVCNI